MTSLAAVWAMIAAATACVHDEGLGAADTRSPEGDASTVDEPRLELLGRDELIAGFDQAKQPVSTCLRAAGYREGDTFKVSMTIQGATGRVDTVDFSDPATEQATRDCVDAALHRMQFERFRRPQMGMVYSFRVY